MATTYTGSITYLRNGKRERIVLTTVPTFQALQTFAAALYPLTTAGICAISWTSSTDPELYEKTGDISEVSWYLRVKLRQVNPPPGHDRAMKLLDIPAPAYDGNFENLPGVGYRLNQAKGESIATAYSALTGEQWQFEEGWICGGK
jgi:hypothetical protein